MIYVATYLNKNYQRAVRMITEGFACTQQELPREIQTRCGSSGQVNWAPFETLFGAELQVRIFKEEGYLDETNL